MNKRVKKTESKGMAGRAGTEEPRVSVLISSYNHEKYVAAAIKSVLDQTYQDFEIVITDDGSTDETVKEIRKFKDPRIRLYEFEENRGAPLSVANCIDNAKGEYIAILSSDDVYVPEKLEKQVKFLDVNPEVWAVFSYASPIDEKGNDFSSEDHYYSNIFKQPNRTRFEWLNYFFYNRNCLCHPSVLARREVYSKIGYPDSRFRQIGDLNIWVKLCLRHEIHILPENLVKFRIREGEKNISGDKPEVHVRSVFEFSQILKNYFAIEKISDFYKIFPSTDGKMETDNDLIPFLLAMRAVEVDIEVYQNFGIEALYRLLGESKIAGKIKDRCGFTYKELIDLSGRLDIYRMRDDWSTSQLFVDTGNRFSEEDSVFTPIRIYPPNFLVHFDFSEFVDIKSFRWDPVEGIFSAVKILDIYYRDSSGNRHQVDVESLTSNGTATEDGTINFETTDPMFFIPVEGDVSSMTISGRISTLDNNTVAIMLQELDQQLAEKDRQLAAMEIQQEERTAQLDEQDKRLEEKDRQLIERERQLVDKDYQLNELRKK